MIEFTATTHPGNRYQHNEDAIGWSEEAGLWFVADGIGGHARGDLASTTVKKALLDASAAANGPEQSLTSLVMLAHNAVLREGAAQALTNMGSTLVLARVTDSKLNIAWCGDSRAYLWRAGKLIRLTRDHSLLEQLLESGVVAPEEAFGHPRRNVLVQALGINDPPPVPSEITLTLDNEDIVLLCSDGIHDELHDDTISEVLTAMSHTKPVSTQAVVEELERRVLATDARDNLSVICLRAMNLEPRAGGAILQVEKVQASPGAEQAETAGDQTVRRSAATTQQRYFDSLESTGNPGAQSDQADKIADPATADGTRSQDPSTTSPIMLLGLVLLVALVAALGWFLNR